MSDRPTGEGAAGSVPGGVSGHVAPSGPGQGGGGQVGARVAAQGGSQSGAQGAGTAPPRHPVPKPGPHLAGAIRRPSVGQAPRQRVEEPRARLSAFVEGVVQGVGFRWWTRSRALELGLVGTATNLPDGRVHVVAEGPRRACEKLLVLLSEQPPRDPPPRAPRSWYRRPGLVSDVAHTWEDPAGGFTGFKEA